MNQTPYYIREPRQLAAIVSPVRQEILDVLAAAGPLTVSQIATFLGRRPDALYYHVTALQKVKLLLVRDRIRAGKRFSAVYDLPGRPLRIDYTTKLKPAAIARVIRAALRLADRDFTRGFRHPAIQLTGDTRNLWGARVKGWAKPQDLPEINRLIHRACSLLQSGAPADDAVPHSLTFVLSPVATKRTKP